MNMMRCDEIYMHVCESTNTRDNNDVGYTKGYSKSYS